MAELVLASASPQRRQILEDLGLRFTLEPQGVEEEDAGVPRAVASENALRKALSAAGPSKGRDSDRVILGVDTLVATELEIWGKPPNAEAAKETLQRLSGRTHEVVGAMVIVQHGDVRATTEVTKVTFRELDEATIDWYIRCGEWEGRAGGYAIQGRGGALVARLEGDYLNVVGLSVKALLNLLPTLMADFRS